MNTLDAIKARRSVRGFTDKQIADAEKEKAFAEAEVMQEDPTAEEQPEDKPDF